MNTLAINNPLASEIKCTEDELIVSLKDGRVLHLPLSWFPRLLHATPMQRNDFEILGDGEGVYWDSIDEDLSVKGFLQGISIEQVSA